MHEVVNRLNLLPTAQMLLAGGDARLRVEAGSGVNRYGCSPLPTPHVAAFGSSTASSISEAGFAAADSLRDRLLTMVDEEAPELTYARELNRIRQELLQLCGIADMRGLETVIAASGTDSHLIAAQIAAGCTGAPTLVIMMDAAETGRGVAAALRGRHFSSRSALGRAAKEGALVAEGTAIELSSVPIRTGDGGVRPIAEVDAEVNALIDCAAKNNQRVLLIAIDVSKTGLIAPSSACVSALHDRYPDTVDVLIDACQFRIAPATLRAYLEHDCMVALTGSKFMTGPAFSGALLIPSSMASRLRHRVLPRAMSAYSTRAEWPRNWAASGRLDDIENFGLLLRWEAALAELRAFRGVPDAQVAGFLRKFGDAVQGRLNRDPVFMQLEFAALDRRPLIAAPGWDLLPTIFPFLLLRPGSARLPLNREQALRIYELLQSGSPGANDSGAPDSCFQLGQPVECGERDGVATSALRICASSRLIVEAGLQDGKGAQAVISRAMAALDRTALLVKTMRC